MLDIVTYRQAKDMKASFYIQSKGNHAGRPLKQPIPNCFAVYTDQKNIFEIVYILWIARKFEYYIIGSVIPFIRIGDVKKIVAFGLEHFKAEQLNYLKLIAAIDNSIKETKMRAAELNRLKEQMALSLLKA